MEKSFNDFLIDAKDKSIVFFGTGEYLTIAKKLLSKHNLAISYAVDNDFWKNGTSIDGIEVCTVDRLIHSERNKICVLICDRDIYNITEQLKNWDIYDFYALPLFAEEWYRLQSRFYMEIPLSNKTPSKWRQQCHITIVNECNLNCPFCTFAENSSTGEFMPYEAFVQIVEQLKSLRIVGQSVDTTMLGGNREGLLHPNFADMLCHLSSQGITPRLTTNAIFMTKEIATVIAKHVRHICISITGVTNEVYHHFQGSKRDDSDTLFNTVVNNISELVKIRNSLNSSCYIDIGYICTELSAHQIKDAIHFWKEKGVDRIRFSHDNKEVTLPLKNADVSNICYANKNGARKVCFYSTTIAANGDVYPCSVPGGEYMPIGNCFKTPLSTIFNSNEFYSFVKKLTSLDPAQLPDKCKRCSVIASIK